MAGVQAFIGSWREEEKEGFEAMAEALGILHLIGWLYMGLTSSQQYFNLIGWR